MKKKNVTIGIIGGTGGMGRFFEKIFKNAGHKVLIAGRSTELSNIELSKQSDLIIISTPVSAAIEICGEIGPYIDENKALMDFCSLKEDIVKAMVENTKAEVVGTHPMFGPFTHSLKGQNIILCPGRGNKWLKWIEKEFQNEKAVVSIMDPVDHDKTMAVAQGLTHLITICMGRTLQKLNMFPSESAPYSTPIFKVKNDLIGRLFAQDPHLYATLVGENKHVGNVLNLFLESIEEGKQAMLSNNSDKAVDFLQDIKSFLGDFCIQGLEESNKFMKSVVHSVKNKK